MHLVVFTHSLVSDWNHGNAHFLRGVIRALQAGGHTVESFEPSDGWSLQNLLGDHGLAAVADFHEHFPRLPAKFYDPTYERFAGEPLEAVLDRADAVLTHEWNHPAFVARLGRHRRARGEGASGFKLLFHDTHHRAATAPAQMARYDLGGYDAVLAFGRVIAEIYRANRWHDEVRVWHEAADTSVFTPAPLPVEKERDLIWVGNWGDGERTAELGQFLLGPVRELNLSARVHGVRYPPEAREALRAAGCEYAGYLANHRVPRAFSRARLTVHIPRGPYVQKLPGVPTIRPFEALACGLPLICSPWEDAENLFTPGRDYLVAADGAEMTAQIRRVLNDGALAANLAEHGRETVLARHTCEHRAEELLAILGTNSAAGGCDGEADSTSPGSAPRWSARIGTAPRPIIAGSSKPCTTAGIGSRSTNRTPSIGRRIAICPTRPGRRSWFIPAKGRTACGGVWTQAAAADVIVKASGVGVFDELLEAAVPEVGGPNALRIFWDVDAPRHPRPGESNPRRPVP